jgi:hypothetical protein
MNNVLSSAAGGPPLDQALKAIQARNRMKVMWILTAVPPKLPMVIDQRIVPPPFAAGHSNPNRAVSTAKPESRMIGA